MRRRSIRYQVQRLVLLCSVVSLLLLGGIALLGMMGARDNSLRDGREMGEEAALAVSNTLKQEAEKQLQVFAGEKASQIALELQRIADRTELMGREAGWLREHAGELAPRSINEPRRENAGRLVPQLEYAADANKAALAGEIGLTANLQDLMLQVARQNGEGTAISVASKNGFTISVDTDSAARFANDASNTPLTFNATSRPWYRLAQEKGKMTFTEVYPDSFSGGLRIACTMPYEAYGSFAGVVAMSTYLKNISQLVLNAQAETCFVLDNNGHILFYKDENNIIGSDANLQQDLRNLDNEGMAEAIKAMAKGEEGACNITINGKEYYLAFAPIKQVGWSFAAAIDAEQVLKTEAQAREDVLAIARKNVGNMNTYMTMVMLAMVVVILVIIAGVTWQGRRMGERFVHPILDLSDGVREIASGNLDKKLDIRTGDEIEHLSTCFNAMTDELQSYMKNLTKVTAEKERIATELNVATNIQESMLPNIFPPFPERSEFDIYATMHAAKEVGGDFYDFYMLDENHVVITIADVSGKGVPAALFMVISKTILKNFALTMTGEDDLAAVVSCTNDQLCQNNDAMMFVTAFVGMLDISTGRFVYVNAGHNPPLLYSRKEQTFTYLPVKRNFVMGGMDELDYQGQELLLEPGDKLFLYTDGVTEALSETEELFGEKRLQDCLNASADKPIKDLMAEVKKSLSLHVGEAEQSDDITMLTLVYNGQAQQAEEV
ncbi:SpoIIE family protein phosphatase [Selenomonas ruminantium]|uniref:Sigma-B regulation protein RsbU (Phosphoserine phosphatase) n=1 Tax=Selenomonas ruminantium TaxID=971 RepID=A0A1H0QB26_SELRU|nr:SpoIIE family protein phosphatase [Selenomonas ruminantium]SDP14275.1 sigma-B regulation protein RsbU (phosphoserine phosphatase) [Selenomonas ruminantium]